MNNFPVEILTKTFLFLHLKDKVECMAVCKRWAHTIETFCLLDTIRIISATQIDNIVNKLISEPFLAYQVKRIIFDLDPRSEFSLTMFINHLPNLRVIYMEKSSVFHFEASKSSSNNKHIEYIIDNGSSDMAMFFLKSKNCFRLKRLQLSVSDDAILSNLATSVLPSMPLLTHLSISDIDDTFEGLELLHGLMPSLVEFEIGRLTLHESELPEAIEPAKSVSHLTLMLIAENLDIETKYFQYARKKYPNLLKWEFTNQIRFGDEKEGSKQFYEDGVLPFIHSLASQLKSCLFSAIDMPQDIMDIIDQINHKEKYLEMNVFDMSSITTRLIKSNQIKYITMLSLTFRFTYIPDLKLLKEFTSLKNLEIDFFYPRQSSKITYNIRINELLKICSAKLESIKIYRCTLHFDLQDTQVYKVKTLYIENMEIDKGIESFIRRQLPDLKRLTFDSVYFAKNKFSLPDTNLSHFQVTNPMYFENGRWAKNDWLNVLVTTTEDIGGRLFYSRNSVHCDLLDLYFKRSDYSVYPPVTSVPYEETNLWPTMSFRLASVKKVTIGNSAEKPIHHYFDV